MRRPDSLIRSILLTSAILSGCSHPARREVPPTVAPTPTVKTPEPIPAPTPEIVSAPEDADVMVERADVSHACRTAVNTLIAVAVHMTTQPGSPFSVNEYLAFPVDAHWPDYILVSLQQAGFSSPEKLLEVLSAGACLGPPIKVGRDWLKWNWPDWYRVGREPTRDPYDSSDSYFKRRRIIFIPEPGQAIPHEYLQPVTKPQPFFSPAPGQSGPTSLERFWWESQAGQDAVHKVYLGTFLVATGVTVSGVVVGKALVLMPIAGAPILERVTSPQWAEAFMHFEKFIQANPITP